MTVFDVYSDFEYYTGGVYHHTGAGKPVGGHAVKIVGWGQLRDDTKYWIGANSWGSSWGEDGFFKFEMN